MFLISRSENKNQVVRFCIDWCYNYKYECLWRKDPEAKIHERGVFQIKVPIMPANCQIYSLVLYLLIYYWNVCSNNIFSVFSNFMELVAYKLAWRLLDERLAKSKDEDVCVSDALIDDISIWEVHGDPPGDTSLEITLHHRFILYLSHALTCMYLFLIKINSYGLSHFYQILKSNNVM
jgi:hypothetical protein